MLLQLKYVNTLNCKSDIISPFNIICVAVVMAVMAADLFITLFIILYIVSFYFFGFTWF